MKCIKKQKPKGFVVPDTSANAIPSVNMYEALSYASLGPTKYIQSTLIY